MLTNPYPSLAKVTTRQERFLVQKEPRIGDGQQFRFTGAGGEVCGQTTVV